MLIQSFGWQNTQILLGATWWVCAILSGLIVVDNINARGASKKSSKGLKMGKLIPLKVNPPVDSQILTKVPGKDQRG